MRPKSSLLSFEHIAEVARGRGVFSKILAEDPGYKKGWDKDGVAAKENRRHGIDREVFRKIGHGDVEGRDERGAMVDERKLEGVDGAELVIVAATSLGLVGSNEVWTCADCPCLNVEAIGCSRRMRGSGYGCGVAA
jgi:hypothetical protein